MKRQVGIQGETIGHTGHVRWIVAPGRERPFSFEYHSACLTFGELMKEIDQPHRLGSVHTMYKTHTGRYIYMLRHILQSNVISLRKISAPPPFISFPMYASWWL